MAIRKTTVFRIAPNGYFARGYSRQDLGGVFGIEVGQPSKLRAVDTSSRLRDRPVSTLLGHTPDAADCPLRRDCGHRVDAGQVALSANCGHSALRSIAAVRGRADRPRSGQTAAPWPGTINAPSA